MRKGTNAILTWAASKKHRETYHKNRTYDSRKLISWEIFSRKWVSDKDKRNMILENVSWNSFKLILIYFPHSTQQRINRRETTEQMNVQKPLFEIITTSEQQIFYRRVGKSNLLKKWLGPDERGRIPSVVVKSKDSKNFWDIVCSLYCSRIMNRKK